MRDHDFAFTALARIAAPRRLDRPMGKEQIEQIPVAGALELREREPLGNYALHGQLLAHPDDLGIDPTDAQEPVTRLHSQSVQPTPSGLTH